MEIVPERDDLHHPAQNRDLLHRAGRRRREIGNAHQQNGQHCSHLKEQRTPVWFFRFFRQRVAGSLHLLNKLLRQGKRLCPGPLPQSRFKRVHPHSSSSSICRSWSLARLSRVRTAP